MSFFGLFSILRSLRIRKGGFALGFLWGATRARRGSKRSRSNMNIFGD